MTVSVAVAELYEEVMATLGGNLVDVELSETDLGVCFRKAKRIFQQKGHNNYRREFIVFDVNKDTLVYPLPDRVDTIVRIVKQPTGFSVENPFSQLAYNELFNDSLTSFGSCGDGFDTVTYELVAGRMERLQRIGAYEVQFIHDKFEKTVRFLKAPESKTQWAMEVYSNLSDDEYASLDWVVRWTIAEAKHMIGTAYRKFQNLPGPSGDMSLSGSEYIQEAQQEKEALLQEIQDMTDGDVDFTEIRFG